MVLLLNRFNNGCICKKGARWNNPGNDGRNRTYGPSFESCDPQIRSSFRTNRYFCGYIGTLYRLLLLLPFGAYLFSWSRGANRRYCPSIGALHLLLLLLPFGVCLYSKSRGTNRHCCHYLGTLYLLLLLLALLLLFQIWRLALVQSLTDWMGSTTTATA